MYVCMFFEGGSEYGYYAMQQAYVNTVPFLGTVYFDASVISYLRQQMYANVNGLFYLLID